MGNLYSQTFMGAKMRVAVIGAGGDCIRVGLYLLCLTIFHNF